MSGNKPLSERSIEDILNSHGHLALIGKFSIPEGVEDSTPNPFVMTYTRDALKGGGSHLLPFELRYAREEKKIDDVSYGAFKVFCPKDAEGDSSKPIPLSSTALESALSKDGANAWDIGGLLFKELLDALDILSRFWHPNFDRVLTETFFYYTKGFTYNCSTFTDSNLKQILYNPQFNRALLGYLRAPQSDVSNYFQAVVFALEQLLPEKASADSRTLILNKLQSYKKALSKELPNEGSIHTSLHKHTDDEDAGFEFLKKQKIPGYPAGTSVPELYRVYRTSAKVVEDLTRCEPLIALIIYWFFRKVTNKTSTKDIREDLYSLFYENNPDWKPLLSKEAINEDHDFYVSEFKKRYADREKKFGKSSARAIVYKSYMRRLVAYRENTWKTNQRYSYDAIIDETVDRFVSLANETNSAVKQLIEQGETLLNDVHPVYLTLGIMYAEPDTITVDSLLELAAKLPDILTGQSSYMERMKEVLSSSGLSGKELGDLFRKHFHMELVDAHDGAFDQLLDEKEKELAEQLKRIDTIYRLQLVAAKESTKEEIAVAVPAGSLAGVREVEEDEDNTYQVTEGARGSEELYKKHVLRKGNPIPINIESLQDSPFKEEAQPENVTWNSEEQTLEFTVNFDEKMLSSLQGELKEEVQIRDALDSFAKSLDQEDVSVETIKSALLEQGLLTEPSMASSRGVLRANILGEFILFAPGELSPLEKKNTSLGVPILLEIVEKVGAKRDFEGEQRKNLIKPETNLECGVKDVNLHSYWEVPGEKATALSTIEKEVALWQGLANGVLAIREYIADMKEAKKIIELMGSCSHNNCYLSVVNQTIEELSQGYPEDLFLGANISSEIPPPSVVYVSGQALPQGSTGSLVNLEQTIIGPQNSLLAQLSTKTGKLFGVPVFLGRTLENDTQLPVISDGTSHLYELSVFLCDPEHLKFREKIGSPTHRDLNGMLGVKVGSFDEWKTAWLKYMRQGQNLEALVLSKLATYGFLYLSANQNLPKARDVISAGVDVLRKLLNGQKLDDLRGIFRIPDNDGWKSVPERTAMSLANVRLATFDKNSANELTKLTNFFSTLFTSMQGR